MADTSHRRYDNVMLYNLIIKDWSVYRIYPLKTFPIVYLAIRVLVFSYTEISSLSQSGHNSWPQKFCFLDFYFFFSLKWSKFFSSK